jgi:hypothetical protein
VSDREFLLGILWSVWWLHSAHGEDTYAEDLLLETVGSACIERMRRLAIREQYHFKRGFWAELRRKAQR